MAETEVHVSNATSKPWWTPSRLFSTASHNLEDQETARSTAFFLHASAMDLFCCTYVSSSSGLSEGAFKRVLTMLQKEAEWSSH